MFQDEWEKAKAALLHHTAKSIEMFEQLRVRLKHAENMIDLALQSADPSQKVFLELAKELIK